MLRILKPQLVGYFRDGFPFQEHLPGLFHQIMPDIPRGAFSGTGTDLVWYTAPTIINTFIEAYGFKGKTVIFFATSGGSSIDKANADFKKQYPEINWKAGKTLNSESKAEIKAWAEGPALHR